MISLLVTLFYLSMFIGIGFWLISAFVTGATGKQITRTTFRMARERYRVHTRLSNLVVEMHKMLVHIPEPHRSAVHAKLKELESIKDYFASSLDAADLTLLRERHPELLLDVAEQAETKEKNNYGWL